MHSAAGPLLRGLARTVADPEDEVRCVGLVAARAWLELLLEAGEALGGSYGGAASAQEAGSSGGGSTAQQAAWATAKELVAGVQATGDVTGGFAVARGEFLAWVGKHLLALVPA